MRSRENKEAFTRRAFIVGGAAFILSTSLGGDNTAVESTKASHDVLPRAEQSRALEVVSDTKTVAPTTTTTEVLPVEVLPFRELAPGEVIGTMNIYIAATGEVIARQLAADDRTHEALAAGQPVDPNPQNPVLDAGAMLHRDSFVPAIREFYVDEASQTRYQTIIGSHRNTVVEGQTFHNIDQIVDGDIIEIVLNSGELMRYQAVGNERVAASDADTLSRIFSTTYREDRIALYACDTSDPNGVPEPGTGRYTNDLRYFVYYQRLS